jgi:hypothetical protein
VAAAMNHASSTRTETTIRDGAPTPVEIERLLSEFADSPTAAVGMRLIRSLPSHGMATQPTLTLVNDSSSMLRNVRVTREAAPWVDYVSCRLDAIAENTELGLPAAEVINRARSWILHLLPPGAPAPAVLPSEDGGIDFVWHRDGWNVEIGVEPDGTETVWTWNRDSDEEVFGDLEEHRDLVVDLIRALTPHG